ncbi:MAG: tyrosine recombinase XerC [Ruminococcaceae bacterium]|nr:tyrosine recombinase XerC [Oscillospiraceae bacterium]
MTLADFQYGILPYYADDFLVYLEAISGKSKNTINEYYYDLLMFFRFMKTKKNPSLRKEEFQNICVNDYSVQDLSEIRLSDLYSFLNYMNNDRKDQAPTRARKVACLRSFFKYVWNKANLIPENPAAELESPKITKKLPKYLELNESIALLDSIDGDFKERDFCIITLFLNCGMRLSELVGINISDIREDTLTVIGKGAKERTIYLNDACLNAIQNYIKVRPDYEEPNGLKPLFLSKRKQRISPKTVQYTVKKYIKLAELDPTKYSTHKLRHTAATLMYTVGDVDIRSLQEILGHESVATTEIYTHVNNSRLKDAVNKNPLAGYKKEEKPND